LALRTQCASFTPLHLAEYQLITIDGYGLTDPGLVRANNEDAFVIDAAAGFGLVSDGMGGAAAGELAAQIFSETAVEIFNSRDRRSQSAAVEKIRQTFQLANQRILDHVEAHPEHKGMGCTAELAVFCDTGFVIGHMGDSRTYRWRKGSLQQLTRDHSLVQEQIEQGIITADEARFHSLRHVILRAVGVDERPALDLLKGEARSGDLFLLCSDGLSDMLEDQWIAQILAESSGLTQKSQRLVEAALTAGGKDNVTVVIIEVLPRS
jgi:serine/threonine protein phosphatase PrpC